MFVKKSIHDAAVLKNTELEQQVATLTQQLGEAGNNEKLTALETENAGLKTENESLKTENANLKTQVETLTGSINTLTSQVEELNTANETITAENETLRSLPGAEKAKAASKGESDLGAATSPLDALNDLCKQNSDNPSAALGHLAKAGF